MLNIKFIRRLVEIIFIVIFIYSSFYIDNNYGPILKIWIVTLLIFTSFAVIKLCLAKENLRNLFSPTILFFITLSATQTIKNMYMPYGLPILLYEIIHYALILFILSYNFKNRKFLDTGLVLFIVYSFRIFDLRLTDNEFVLIHALTLILALIWFEEAYTKQERLPKVNSIFIPLIILIIVAIFSTINAACPHHSLAQTMIMINFIFVTLLMATYLKDIRQINIFILTLFLIGSVLIILAMNEVLSKLVRTGGVSYALGRIWIGRTGGRHLPSIHANSLAGYFAALLCLIIGSLPFYKARVIKRWVKLFIIIMLFILGLTYSRLGILSFIFALTILSVFRHKKLINFIRRKPLFLILSATFIIAIIALSPIKENIISRLRHTHSSNSSLYSCKISLAAIKDNPLFGAGLENYYILSKYAKQPMSTPLEDAITTSRNLTMSAPHSLYLGIAFGLGTVGLLVFIWLVINFVAYCLRLNNYIHTDGYEKSLLQGILAAFVSVIVHGILSMTFHLTVLPVFFWIFIGLAISIGNIKGYNKIDYKLRPGGMKVALIMLILISIGIVVNPILAERYYILAVRKFNLGKLNEAIDSINWAKRFMPINPKFYALTAEVQMRQGLIDAAIESYKKALHFKRNFAFYYTKLGQLYQQKKMYSYALRGFNQAIALDKFGAYFGEHYSDLGFLYEAMGIKDEAIAQFKKAILIDPGVVKNSAWRGIKYLDEILNQLYQDYRLEKDKNSPTAKQTLFSLKKVYYYLREFDKAGDNKEKS